MNGFRLLILVLAVNGLSVAGSSQSTAFSYQGNLSASGMPANGRYDLEFALFDSLTGGTQLGSTFSALNIEVTNGTFAVTMDFGNQFPGGARFLEILVRPAGSGPYTALSPRQRITTTPYSVRSLNAATADSVTAAGGIPAGSGNYIQNTTNPQASANFNISGTGRANILSALTQFNLGSNRVLGILGGLAVGINSGLSSTGEENSFFGNQSGRENTTGYANSIFGSSAGVYNTTGFGNSYFGVGAGRDNVGGSNNSFFGVSAGQFGLSGNNNTLLGANTVYGTGISFGTAIGAGAVVGASDTVVLGRPADTVRIPGSLTLLGIATGDGSGLTNLNASSIATGSLNPARLGGATILNQISQQPSSNFNISGNGAVGGQLFASNVNVANDYRFNGERILGYRGSSLVLGNSAGQGITSGNFNTLMGIGAGINIGSGNSNTFVGDNVGTATTSGSNNTFIGASAGTSNILGNANTLIGSGTGLGGSGLSYATAIGSGASVSTSNTIALGRPAGTDLVQIPGELAILGKHIFGSSLIDLDGSDVSGTSARLRVQGSDIFFGRGGCPTGSAVIGLNGDLGNCTNYTMRGSGPDVLFNRPDGGEILFRESNGATQVRIRAGGALNLAVLGTAGGTALCRNASNDVAACSSSARYKTNITPFEAGLGLIRELRPVSFRWRDGGMNDLGLVAEDVAAVEPLLATHNDKGEVEGVKYDRISVVLVNALKEQQKQIDDQKRLIDTMMRYICGKEPAAGLCKSQP